MTQKFHCCVFACVSPSCGSNLSYGNSLSVHQCASVDEWIKKKNRCEMYTHTHTYMFVCVYIYIYIYIHTHIYMYMMEYYIAMEKNEILPYEKEWNFTICINMDGLWGHFDEWNSKTEKDKYYMISLIHGI